MSEPTPNALTLRRFVAGRKAEGFKRASVWLAKDTSDQIDQLMKLKAVKSRDELIALLVSDDAARLGVK